MDISFYLFILLLLYAVNIFMIYLFYFFESFKSKQIITKQKLSPIWQKIEQNFIFFFWKRMTRRRRSVSFSSNHRDPNNGSNSSRSFSRRHLSTSIASNSSSARTSGKPKTNLFNLFLGWGIFKYSSFRLILDTPNPILGRVGTCSIHYVFLHSRKYINGMSWIQVFACMIILII